MIGPLCYTFPVPRRPRGRQRGAVQPPPPLRRPGEGCLERCSNQTPTSEIVFLRARAKLGGESTDQRANYEPVGVPGLPQLRPVRGHVPRAALDQAPGHRARHLVGDVVHEEGRDDLLGPLLCGRSRFPLSSSSPPPRLCPPRRVSKSRFPALERVTWGDTLLVLLRPSLAAAIVWTFVSGLRSTCIATGRTS